MAYRIFRSDQAEADLERIFRHLIDSYIALGEPIQSAVDRAERRVLRIREDMEALARAPHRGTLTPHLGPLIRHVTKDRAVLYFEVDDGQSCIRIIAAFFSGQDHLTHMNDRLKRRTTPEA